MEARKNRMFVCPGCTAEERVLDAEDIHNSGIDDLNGCYMCKDCFSGYISNYFAKDNFDTDTVPCPNSSQCK